MPSDIISEGFLEGKLILFEKAVKYETVREHVTNVPLMNLNSPQSVKVFLEPLFEESPIEALYAVALNSSNEFLGFIRMSQGTVSRAAVYPRELISFLLIESNATAVILAHNHPGGCARPSQEDISLTKRIMKLLEGLEVRLLDHLIYAPGRLGQEGSWVSLKIEGHLS
ncbi:MAG: JAB domain-containing protein [Candidatus Fermentibacteraceae bacterium]|nr:JAB domain-containing protein [Candidatus Fermentibacteraceae bacterium]